MTRFNQLLYDISHKIYLFYGLILTLIKLGLLLDLKIENIRMARTVKKYCYPNI